MNLVCLGVRIPGRLPPELSHDLEIPGGEDDEEYQRDNEKRDEPEGLVKVGEINRIHPLESDEEKMQYRIRCQLL